MKLKNTVTGIALSVCMAVSSIMPVQAAAEIPAKTAVTSNDVQKEAASTAEYIKGLLGTETIAVTSYRELILMMRSGIDCKTQYNNYIKALSECINEEGKIIFADAENITLYAAAIEILTLGGENPQSFNGTNLVKSFNDCIASYTNASDLNTAIGNPYYYSYIIPAVESYSDEMADSEKILALLKDAMFINYGADDSGCGINYYGYSTDTNGKVLSAAVNYYRTSTNIASMVYAAIQYTLSLQTEDGGFKYDNGEYSLTSNADSTAYALELFSSYDYSEKALETYNALLQFKSETTPGCYTYSGYDSPYAAQDALEGLVSYSLYLDGKNPSPFNVESEKLYTVTLNGNGGKINGKSSYAVSVKTGNKLNLTDAARKNYDFIGWYTSKTGGKKVTSGKAFNGTSNVTYYARWQKSFNKKTAITSAKSTSSKKIQIKFKKVSGAAGYSIEYSTKSDFSKSKTMLTKKNTVTLSGLKSGKTYYIRVCAYNKNQAKNNSYGPYTNAKKVKVK